MRIFVWIFSIVALAVWSLLALAGHALLDWSTDWAAANADKLSSTPETVEWTSWAVRILGNTSEIVVVIVWAIGALLIVGLASLSSRFLSKRGVARR